MEKILLSIPQPLAVKLRATIPARQRSKLIVCLLEKELQQHEQLLHNCALAVEQDAVLRKEMQEWDVTSSDGLEDETW